MEERLNELLLPYQGRGDKLISILQQVQEELSYLPEYAMTAIAKVTGLPESRVYAVASFYAQFRFTPRGKHTIMVCRGTACHVRGAGRILEVVQDVTGLKPGLTDQDFKFSLETVNCVGCCALGPVMIVDGEHHGKLAPAKSKDVLNNYQ